MIKSEAQKERTMIQIEGFRRALAKAVQEKPSKRAAAVRGSYEGMVRQLEDELREYDQDRKSTRLNSSHRCISYAVFCLTKKKRRKSNAPNYRRHHLFPTMCDTTFTI